MDIPDELIHIIFTDVPITIKRIISKKFNILFNDIFITKMHHISPAHKKEYAQTNIIGSYSNSDFKVCIVNNNEKIVSNYVIDQHECRAYLFDRNIDLMSKYNILCQRTYPNKEYVKNIIKKDLLMHKLYLYSKDYTYYMYCMLITSAVTMGVKCIANIEPYIYGQRDYYTNINKQLYKDVEAVINDL